MGCCSNCDKGLPCSDDAPKAVSMTGNAGSPRAGAGMTPLQAAMVGKTVMAQLSGARARHPAVARGAAMRGFGQSGGCLPGFSLQNPNDPTSPCVGANGQPVDVNCPQGQLTDAVTQQCAPICPDGSRPANGCPPETGIKLWWDTAPTWQKAAAVGGGAVAVGGLGWLLFHKKSPVHKALKKHVR